MKYFLLLLLLMSQNTYSKSCKDFDWDTMECNDFKHFQEKDSLSVSPIDRLQNNINPNQHERIHEFMTTIPNYEGIQVPMNLSNGDILTMASLATSAVIFFNNDQEIMDFVQENRNDVTEPIAYWGEKMGHADVLGAGGYILGVVLKNNEIKNTSLMIVKSGITAGLITRLMKMSFSRKRPNEDEGPNEFGGFNIDNEHVSFPSGHTTSAFSFATVIAETYKDRSKLIPVLAYGAAAIGGWSRVHDRAHWASDVAIGALVGHFTAKYMIRRQNENAHRSHDITFYPAISDEFVGLKVQVRRRPTQKNMASEFFKDCKENYSERDCFQEYLRMIWQG